MSKSSSLENKKIIVKNIPVKTGKEMVEKMIDEFEKSIDYYDFIHPNDHFCSLIIHFKKVEDLTEFKKRYNGQSFFSEKGEQIKLEISYCVNQRYHCEGKKDEMEGTLENDLYYKAFVMNFNKK